jgi:thiol-disulfide isomerase/thioredoxin
MSFSNRLGIVLCLIIGLVGCDPGAGPSPSGGASAGGADTSTHPREGWLENYEAAVVKSKETGKPILAEFTGSDWCPPCIQLNNDVFSKPIFKDWAAENVVLLELDYPNGRKLSPELKEQNDKLAQKYGIQFFPTVMLLSAEGEVKGKLEGYSTVSAEDWIQSINDHLGN